MRYKTGSAKMYYSISEVSDMTGVKAHVLRYWETEFPSLRPKKNRAGNRNYRPKDIKAILVIRDLLYREKFTISGARKKLQEHYGNPDPLINQLQIPFADPEARQILKEFAAGPLWRRLWSLRDCIIARELPVWLPPSMVESGRGGDPVGFASGMIDLAYRHPEEGALVVADYKTDRVDSEQELQSRAQEYRDQGRLYAHAIRGALQLEALPRFELWFLRAGRTVWVPVDG